MATAPIRLRVSRRPDARPGQHATFYFADGRCLEVSVPGAIALASAGSRGHAAACALRDEHGVILGELEGFADLLSRKPC
jgi:hypothetical protein